MNTNINEVAKKIVDSFDRRFAAPTIWQSSSTRSVFGNDTHYKQLAMSILTGMDFLDGDRYGPILPVEMAKDVCRWAGYEVI